MCSSDLTAKDGTGKSAAMALAIPSDPAAKQALDDGLKDAPAAVQTIRQLIAAAEAEDKEVPAGFTLLDEAPAMRTRRSHRRRANSGGSRSRASNDESRTLTDAELKELRENRAAAEKARESARRAQMAAEEEGAANLLEEVDESAEGEEEEGEEEGAEEEEVEAMELDD